ncbi:transglycosylase SLT domain protein [Escherichia coli DEC7B]|nr:transglycosylase SLT domain protein [Escherichia coli DEC7B]
MKKWMLAICLMFINGICEAADCFDLAGRDYKIDPDLLRAISWKESRYRVNAIGINPVTGYGSGLMQVDSQHFNELARYGINPEHLTTDPCMNIYTGAYYLAIAFKNGASPGRPLVHTMQDSGKPNARTRDVLPTHQMFTGFIPG